MNTNIFTSFRGNLRAVVLCASCIVGSFVLGVETAGDVQPITLIEAGTIQRAGDIDGNGIVDIQDVIDILEVSQGYADVSPEQLKADPNGDGILSVDDAISVLSALAL